MFSQQHTQESSGYEIQRSLRFNQADDTYLNRTPASAGNRTTWTWSAWIKRATISDFQYSVFGAGTVNTNYDEFRLTTADKFRFFIVSGGSVVLDLLTTQVFRDPSAWYHFVVAYDSTQATASNRCKLYVNGVQITALDTATYPAQNTSTTINNNVQHAFGLSVPAGFEYNGYQTEINFIDGQALTPSSFGEFSADTGVWQPKRYGGSYGTNGFYLNFSNNSNTTAATLGADYSGNGNNWTPNNFSVSAGSGNDSVVDVPTAYGTDTGVGGTVRGNYCTLNPTSVRRAFSLSNGNLQGVNNGNNDGGSTGTIALPTTGKWYWEATQGPLNGGVYLLYTGLWSKENFPNDTFVSVPGAMVYPRNTAVCFYNNTGTASCITENCVEGDVYGVAYNADTGVVDFYKNGVMYSGQSVTVTQGITYYPFLAIGNQGPVASINFGQRPFAYTAPAGFKALCTQNLPTPTVGATPATQANQFFTPVLYTGNGADNRTISAGMTPDWTWIKIRSGAFNHILFDSVRGTGKYLLSNTTNAENFAGTLDWTNSGTTTGGFKVDAGSNDTINGNGGSYVAWNWAANGAGVTNTAGSITSTVSANTTSGFSVVNWTANGTDATIGHGLGVAPRMIIVKARNNEQNWYVYHAGLAAPHTSLLLLNTTSAALLNNGIWQNTFPTSSVFSVNAATFPNTWTYVAYCFAEVPGYSRFGSYTGNGSTDGPFVFCGFRPAYVMVKRSDQNYGWWIFDGKRPGYNVTSNRLSADTSDAEFSNATIVDFTSNGFKWRDASQGWNGSGGTIIFMAFAEVPQKFALAR